MRTKVDDYVIEKVREIRLAKNVSGYELSMALNFAHSFVSNRERKNSTYKYNVEHLNDIAVVLRCSIKDFFPDEPFVNNEHK